MQEKSPLLPHILIGALTNPRFCEKIPTENVKRSISMKEKALSLMLILLMFTALLTGCSTVGEIAGNVADAAKTELENQVQAVLDEYKMDIIEVKTTVGRLNSDGQLQFFCAVLVRAADDSVPASCADALGKVFSRSGVIRQTGSTIESSLLEKKSLSYSFSDFSDGNSYYTIYAYSTIHSQSN